MANLKRQLKLEKDEKEEQEKKPIPVPPDMEPVTPVHEPPPDEGQPTSIEDDNPEKNQVRIFCKYMYFQPFSS